jgi:uncharacterized protein
VGIGMVSNKLQQESIQAARFGEYDRLITLLAEGADVNSRDLSGTTALMFAAKQGFAEIVDLLIQNHADVNLARGKFGTTALMLAAASGHYSIVQKLLAQGADPRILNSDGSTALMAAALSGSPEIVTALLQAGAEVATIDQDHDTALNIAVSKNHTAVARLLLQAQPIQTPRSDPTIIGTSPR